MSKLISSSALETRRLGKALAAQLVSGDVILLDGGMGNGKSELARGIARGLGVAGAIPSPSFTILNCYDEGRLPLRHFDWYRVLDADELRDSGLDEMVGGEGVTLIEWFERAEELLPACTLTLRIDKTEGDGREIELIPSDSFHFIDLDLLERAIQREETA